MTNVASLATTAAVIGDPARAAILLALMDGRALTAGELGAVAGIAPPTASGHLARMLGAGLLALEQQGRHRYYRIANEAVASLIETIMSATSELQEAARDLRPVRTGPRDLALRKARLCYDHLAGELAVGMADSMIAAGNLEVGSDGAALTSAGWKFLGSIGVELAPQSEVRGKRATFCRPCLDWSERRMHIAGTVGRSICAAFVRQGWLRPATEGRIMTLTPLGVRLIDKHFGLSLS